MINWDAVAAFGETLGALAVVISLLYLARQVQSSTRAQKAAAGFDISTKMSDLNLVLSECILNDPNYQNGGESRLTEVVNKAYSSDARPEDFSPSDFLFLTFVNRAVFQRIEGEYYLYQHGFLDPAQWEARKAWACGYLELPAMRQWWEYEATQQVFRPEFQAALANARGVKVEFPTGMQAFPGGATSHDRTEIR